MLQAVLISARWQCQIDFVIVRRNKDTDGELTNLTQVNATSCHPVLVVGNVILLRLPSKIQNALLHAFAFAS